MQRHLRTLANSRRNPLHGFRADISDGEDSSPVGFQRMAIVASTNPSASSATPEPASQSVFGSAPMNKNKRRIGRRTSWPLVPRRQHRFQDAITAFETADLRARQYFDIGVPFDPID